MNIWISGKKKSGKDTFFAIAREVFKTRLPHIKVIHYAFADLVKVYAETYFGVTKDDCKENIRYVLQGIGKMFRDEVDKDYWIKHVLAKISLDQTEHPEMVGIITDVRYQNEAELAKQDKDSLLLRINRPSLSIEDSHDSETELDNYKFDYYLSNAGDFAEYKEQVTQWLLTNLPLLRD